MVLFSGPHCRDEFRTQLAHQLVRGHGFAGELGMLSFASLKSVSGDLFSDYLRVSEDLRILSHFGITPVFKTTFEVFTRVGADNSLERLTERSVGLVTDRPSDVYELFVTLL